MDALCLVVVVSDMSRFLAIQSSHALINSGQNTARISGHILNYYEIQALEKLKHDISYLSLWWGVVMAWSIKASVRNDRVV